VARPREPIRLIEAKGKKHLTKAEVEERLASEPQPVTDDIAPPSFLTAAQKKRFDTLAGQLQKIKIMGETDVETLARYVEAQMLYEDATRELRRLKKDKPKREAFEMLGEYYDHLGRFYDLEEAQARKQDRHFKQAQTAARELGLTISSRCKLQVPVKEDEAPPANKFDRFKVAK